MYLKFTRLLKVFIIHRSNGTIFFVVFVGYAREIKNILIYAELKKMENISKTYRERQPPALTTQFGERLPKTEAIK